MLADHENICLAAGIKPAPLGSQRSAAHYVIDDYATKIDKELLI